MKKYFKHINKMTYEGPDSKNPLSLHYYDPKRIVLGKSMEDHLRMAVYFWHTFCWAGDDNFGAGVFEKEWLKEKNPMKRAKQHILTTFEFF